MQRGLVQARDAQARREWDEIEPPELAGRRVVILGLGSIGIGDLGPAAPVRGRDDRRGSNRA